MAQKKLYINEYSRLYIAEEPRVEKDVEYTLGDEWLSTAVQLYPNSTVEDLLPHITQLKNNTHPLQLASKRSIVTLRNTGEDIAVLEARLQPRQFPVPDMAVEFVAEKEKSVAEPALPTITVDDFMRKVMGYGT